MVDRVTNGQNSRSPARDKLVDSLPAGVQAESDRFQFSNTLPSGYFQQKERVSLKKVRTVQDQMELIDLEMKKQAQIKKEKERQDAILKWKRTNEAETLGDFHVDSKQADRDQELGVEFRKSQESSIHKFEEPIQEENERRKAVDLKMNKDVDEEDEIGREVETVLGFKKLQSQNQKNIDGHLLEQIEDSGFDLLSGVKRKDKNGGKLKTSERKKQVKDKKINMGWQREGKNAGSQIAYESDIYSARKSQRSEKQRYKPFKEDSGEFDEMDAAKIKNSMSSDQVAIKGELNNGNKVEVRDTLNQNLDISLEHVRHSALDEKRSQAWQLCEIFNKLCENDFKHDKAAGTALEQLPKTLLMNRLVHTLSIFAIVSDQESVFFKIKYYLKLNLKEMPDPDSTQIYSLNKWPQICHCKTLYVQNLINTALSVAIHANEDTLVSQILDHCKEAKIVLTITSDELSSIMMKDNYQIMKNLISAVIFFYQKKRSYNSIMLQQTDQLFPLKKQMHEAEQNQSDMVHDVCDKREDFSSVPNQFFGHGNQKLSPYHFIRQLFLEFPELTKLNPGTNEAKKSKKKLIKLLIALADHENFAQVIPILVLKGHIDLIYSMIQSDCDIFPKHAFPTTLKAHMASTLFIFALSADHLLDIAFTVLLKYPTSSIFGQDSQYTQQAVEGIFGALTRSAAMIELKLYILMQAMKQNALAFDHMVQLVQIVELDIVKVGDEQENETCVLAVNTNHLLSTLQCYNLLSEISDTIPKLKGKTDKIAKTLIDREVRILDQIPIADYELVSLACEKKDIFGQSCLYYLAKFKPLPILSTQVIQHVVEQYWNSSFFQTQESIFQFSTCVEIIRGNKIQILSLKNLFAGKWRNTSSICAFSFPVWIKGIKLRYYFEIILTFSFYTLMYNIITTYLQPDYKVRDSELFSIFLRKFTTLNSIRELQLLEYGSAFIGHSVCLAFSSYIVLSFLCKALINLYYLDKTEQKKVSRTVVLSYTKIFVLVTYLGHLAFYSTMLCKKSLYLNQSIEAPFIQQFNSNLREYEDNQNIVVNHRFWPSLLMASLLLQFSDLLRLSKELGPYMVVLQRVCIQFATYLILWILTVFFFAVVAVVWIGDFSQYNSVTNAIFSLFLASIGQKDFVEPKNPAQFPGILILHMLFILVAVIGFINFFSGIMTDSLLKVGNQAKALNNSHILAHLPVLRYERNFGWMATMPTLFSPVYLFIIFPLYYITTKCKSNKTTHIFNLLINGMLYLPLMLTQLALFQVFNMALIPFAYFVGLYKLVSVNEHIEQNGKVLGSKWTRVVGYFLIAPIAFTTWTFIADLIALTMHLCRPKSMSREKKSELRDGKYPVYTDVEDIRSLQKVSESPLTVHTLQHLFFILSKHLSNRQAPELTKSALLLELRDSLNISMAFKWLIFGCSGQQDHDDSEVMAKFYTQMTQECGVPTMQQRLKEYTIVKQIVHRYSIPQVDDDGQNGSRLDVDLLYTHVNEIKMGVVARRAIRSQHVLKQDVASICFVSLKRGSDDHYVRSLTISNPLLLKRALVRLPRQYSDNHSKVKRIVFDEVRLLERQIGDQIGKLASSLLTQMGASIDDIKEKSKLFKDQTRIFEEPVQQKRSKVSQYIHKMAQLNYFYAYGPYHQASHLKVHKYEPIVKPDRPIPFLDEDNVFDPRAYVKEASVQEDQEQSQSSALIYNDQISANNDRGTRQADHLSSFNI